MQRSALLSVLTTALGTLVCASRSARLLAHPSRSARPPNAACGAWPYLTFEKLPIGILHIWDVANWEIVTEKLLSENCPW